VCAHLGFDVAHHFPEKECVGAVDPDAFQVRVAVVEGVAGHGVAFSGGAHRVVVVFKHEQGG